jgi:hypothetical protein
MAASAGATVASVEPFSISDEIALRRSQPSINGTSLASRFRYFRSRCVWYRLITLSLAVGSYWIHRHIAIGSKFILAVVMQSLRPEGMASAQPHVKFCLFRS